MCVSLRFFFFICGLSLVAESRVQKTELLFADHRAHASPNCRMSLSASAEPPLCVMSSKAIFGCSPSIFDRKPRSKVEIPLQRGRRRHGVFCFSFSHSDFAEPTTKHFYLQAVGLSFCLPEFCPEQTRSLHVPANALYLDIFVSSGGQMTGVFLVFKLLSVATFCFN